MVRFYILIILQAAYFVCNTYPKHIIEINGPVSIIAVLLNLLYFAAFSFFMVKVFRKNDAPQDGPCPSSAASKRTIFLTILLVWFARIFFDAVLLFWKSATDKTVFYLIDAVTIVEWIIYYSFCVKKEDNLFRGRRGVFAAVAFAVLFAAAVWYDHRLIERYSYVADMYSAASLKTQTAAVNMEFLFQLKTLFLDIAGCLVLVIAHFAFKKADREKEMGYHAKQALRLFLVTAAFVILVAIKEVAFPYSSLLWTIGGGGTERHYQEKGLITAETQAVTFGRATGYHTGKTVYAVKKNRIYHNEELMLEYTSENTGSGFDTFHIDDKDPAAKDPDVSDSSVFYLYRNEALCYMDNESLIVLLNDQSGIGYRTGLASIYRTLIRNEQWTFFRQASEYLMQLDPDFVRPYLERFAAGDFHGSEKQSMEEACINETYVRSVSQKLLKTN